MKARKPDWRPAYYHSCLVKNEPFPLLSLTYVDCYIDMNQYEFLCITRNMESGSSDFYKEIKQFISRWEDSRESYHASFIGELEKCSLHGWFERGFANNNGAIVLATKKMDFKGSGKSKPYKVYFISKKYKEELMAQLFKEIVLA